MTEQSNKFLNSNCNQSISFVFTTTSKFELNLVEEARIVFFQAEQHSLIEQSSKFVNSNCNHLVNFIFTTTSNWVKSCPKITPNTSYEHLFGKILSTYNK